MFRLPALNVLPAVARLTGASRLADRVESVLWVRHDVRAVVAGLQVTRTGRWTRHYRDPRLAIALAAIAARAADEGAACAGFRPVRSERAA